MDLKEERNILRNMNLKVLDVEEILRKCEAYWSFQGERGEPHALLTSGRHSDCYFVLNRALQFTNIENHFAKELIEKLRRDLGITYVDCVASSSYAAVTFGRTVASELGSKFVFTEKQNGKQIPTDRFNIAPGSNVLQVEELITTMKTTRQVKKAMEKQELSFVKKNGKNVVATIVYRPAKIMQYPDYEVISLMERENHSWAPAECPLCLRGSKPMKPKSNWPLFIS
ncbi:MAG: hypothetical protein GF370_02990 [Candidatus Nealsonbacteria bacterium]|nr:hypothetical protein [Candidatus Nealsonbacteria bacterium]